MSLIQCIDLGIEFAGTYVLKGINCSIEHNSRIGLIGPNGSGKSTLIKLILGELRPSDGQVIKARNCRIAYLAQNAILNPDTSLKEYISSARSDIRDLHFRMTDLSERLSIKEDSEIHAELDAVVEKMHQCGAFEHENEIKYVLSSLGFTDLDTDKLIRDFSGGEQTRICLAYLLLAEFDLLIMDEPTNHLDIAMTRWLERYLITHECPYMVVSHDRVFLDNVCRSIYSLESASLSITKGNYSSWYEAGQIERKSRERQFERQQKFIAETQDFIRRNMGSQKTSQAKSRLKMLEKLDVVKAPQRSRQSHLHFASADRSGNDVFSLKDAIIGINPDLVLARKVNIEAHWQDRIALIGPNGCGKSTLLKILLGRHEVLEGKLKIGASLKTAYYDQHQNALNPDKTVMETLWSIVPEAPRGYVLSWLARFSFLADDVDKYVSVLSGGEKSRLYLSVLIHQKPNLLILDEPTNHLDIPMRDALLEALSEFNGTIIFVSHDRHFISSLANKFWVFRKFVESGKIYNSIQDAEGPADAAIESAFSEPELSKDVPSPRERKKKINPWHLEQLQKTIEAKQHSQKEIWLRREHIHGLLADSATYNDARKVKELTDEDKELELSEEIMKKEISALEDKYLELAYED
ncbi:MAG: ATP-binding cassette domain-containing protein [Candidatus Cloacimonetes bacterium]|jgi:ATP-binding cassette subfamily F protein 3|nr:ATP-binding cassette domain-containing protein [Candidatus Cloacimonadota bacterium]MCK9433223.1 ATP-binding cassette domain-containing protein [Candidatus Cloacimonadota bacterium]